MNHFNTGIRVRALAQPMSRESYERCGSAFQLGYRAGRSWRATFVAWLWGAP